MIYENAEKEALRNVAKKMCAAARTAPKAKGVDNLSVILIDGGEISRLADKMEEIGKRAERFAFYTLNALCTRKSSAVLLIGTTIKTLDLDCGYCGFGTCDELKKTAHPCSYNTGDLGIAIGSAVSVAARSHIDNRIMLSCGKAAIEAGFFDDTVKIAYGIPLSVTGKNIFFGKPKL